MIEKILVLVIFLIGFVSALDVEIDCPDEVFVDEEFECEVEVFDGDEEYDLKVEVDDRRDSVLRVWDDGEWKSSYYYLADFIEDEEDVRLKFEDVGKYDLVVKLREGDSRSEFDVGRIKVLEREVEEVEEDEILVADDADDANLEEAVISLGGEPEVISLGGNAAVEEEEEEWDYVSKDGKIIDWLPYVFFCLFLILVIGILFWERF